ncbi:hypothetical protein D3C84_665700 [compost metagenome]
MAACRSLRAQPMARSSGMTMELKLYSSSELELVATPTTARISTCQPRLNSALLKLFMLKPRRSGGKCVNRCR